MTNGACASTSRHSGLANRRTSGSDKVAQSAVKSHSMTGCAVGALGRPTFRL